MGEHRHIRSTAVLDMTATTGQGMTLIQDAIEMRGLRSASGVPKSSIGEETPMGYSSVFPLKKTTKTDVRYFPADLQFDSKRCFAAPMFLPENFK